MRRVLVVSGTLLLFSVLAVFWWKFSLSPVSSKDTTVGQFAIAKGDGVREVAKKLRDQGFIRDQVAFFLLVKKLRIEKNIQAGSFRLSPSMSAYDIANKFTVGIEDLWVTIPEGWRSEEILEYLSQQGFNTANENWRADEGKLFPDTYRLPKGSSISAVHDLLRQTFDSKTAGLKIDTQTLILASIIEREAKFSPDRPLVASVILNRLAIGMKLDIDATVQYALGKPGSWWPKNLTLDGLKMKSPYNTYVNAGLPPTPISNPGLSAIQAIINPAKTNYLYYLTGNDGQMHYASTLDQHNANVAKYIQ